MPTLFPSPVGLDDIVLGDCFDWLARRQAHSIRAVVTDPPFGPVEYTARELEKIQSGQDGIWRIPPSFDGCRRIPLPRLTVLTERQRADLRTFFQRLAQTRFKPDPVLDRLHGQGL